MSEPDETKYEPQVEANRSGIGPPPRNTAVGLGSEEEGEGDGPIATLNWWQRLMTKAMMFLLNVDPKIDKDNN